MPVEEDLTGLFCEGDRAEPERNKSAYLERKPTRMGKRWGRIGKPLRYQFKKEKGLKP
jgi:hypothetical protein